MPPVIDATVGGPSANSYALSTDADTYFVNRLALVPPWSSPSASTPNELAALIMATRLLGNLAQPFKTFFEAEGSQPAYYRMRRQWTGQPATPSQKLAWPRIGMFDANGNPLDLQITSNSVAAATVISTYPIPHRQVTGTQVLIWNDVTSVPSINGSWTITVIDQYTFSIPLTVTTGGIYAKLSWIPQDLKDAESEFAGQLLAGDRSLDNAVITQGVTSVRAGSVAVTFKKDIIPQVIPDAVFNLMPQSWLTDEAYILANQAVFDVASIDPTREANEGNLRDFD